jgi:integrase/recombinase XerD
MIYEHDGSRKYLNDQERRAFLMKVESLRNFERENFCLMLWQTGFRISETLALIRSSSDLASGCVVFRTLKRRRNNVFRAIPIPDWYCRRLETQLSVARNTIVDRLWPICRTTGWSIVRSVMHLANTEGSVASPKPLRHGFAVASIQRGLPLNLVQRWLGHARIETTAIYTNVIGEEEREFAVHAWKDFPECIETISRSKSDL